MSFIRPSTILLAGVLCLAVSPAVRAQTIGTFTWQQEPYCNAITIAIVQDGGLYRLQGTDDQCAATARAAVQGLAFPNPNGTIGFGLTIVTAPGASALHVDASIALPALSGTWHDSTGATARWATWRPAA